MPSATRGDEDRLLVSGVMLPRVLTLVFPVFAAAVCPGSSPLLLETATADENGG